jgi:hypothetical protein
MNKSESRTSTAPGSLQVPCQRIKSKIPKAYALGMSLFKRMKTKTSVNGGDGVDDDDDDEKKMCDDDGDDDVMKMYGADVGGCLYSDGGVYDEMMRKD